MSSKEIFNGICIELSQLRESINAFTKAMELLAESNMALIAVLTATDTEEEIGTKSRIRTMDD